MNSYQTPERMARKRKAVPLPDLAGKSVLDVGCDHGYWCWLAVDLGASRVLGLDRNRDGIDLIARNEARMVPFCSFTKTNIGKEWREFGRFDVVLCLSMYHHVFENCGDHNAIWFWLWRHTAGELLWENPTGRDDDVVRMNVSRGGYDHVAIREAAGKYFEVEYIGTGHVPTREVWRCKPRAIEPRTWRGNPTSGGGGASKAFAHAGNRRIKEIAAILGYEPYPGTLNLKLDGPFDWDRNYYRAELLETVDRTSLDAEWKLRPVRFYPVAVDGVAAHAIRFEGERYPENYIELIAPGRLATGGPVTVRG